MASFSEKQGEITRPFGSDSMQLMYKQIDDWAVEDGIDFSVDNLSNIRLRSKKHNPDNKTFVVGSHVDTVVNAGKFDGPLGFLIAYEMLLYCEKTYDDTPFNIEAIGFCDEEGVRFQTTYLGSSAVAGIFQNEWMHCTDNNNITLHKALSDIGCNPEKISDCQISSADWLGYYEVHIEQGPVLQQNNLPVGVVKDIYGQIRVEIKIIGFAGHAGTVPMDMRQDALAGLAEFISKMEEYALTHKKDFVSTVGQCQIYPGASNVVPGLVTATIDMRSHDHDLLTHSAIKINEILNQICKRRNLKNDWIEVQRNAPVYCDFSLNAALEQSVQEYCGQSISLSSGAGHDGVAISKVAPICMLFVRSKNGISHNPEEYSSPEDIKAATEVSFLFIKRLISKFKNQ